MSPIWQEEFRKSCFCHSTKGSSLVLQDRARGWARWCLHNKKWICLETLSLGILNSWVCASWIKMNNCPTKCDWIRFIILL